MAPPGAWWFAPDGWVGWVSMKPGTEGSVPVRERECAGTVSRNRRQGQVGNTAGREKKGWRAGDTENRIAGH